MQQQPDARRDVDADGVRVTTPQPRFFVVPFESLAPRAHLAATDDLWRVLNSST